MTASLGMRVRIGSMRTHTSCIRAHAEACIRELLLTFMRMHTYCTCTHTPKYAHAYTIHAYAWVQPEHVLHHFRPTLYKKLS